MSTSGSKQALLLAIQDQFSNLFEGNISLENLDALSNVTSVKGDVNILSNNNFPTCEAENFINQLKNWSGNYKIEDNNDEITCD